MEDQLDLIILTVVASVTSVLLLSLKMCFKSKCVETECCFGCIRVKRDVKYETELENKVKENKPQTIGQAYPSESNLQQSPQGSDSVV